MIQNEARRTAIHRPPPAVEPKELFLGLWSGSPPTVLDVRPEALFRAGHIEGAIHSPDANTTALVQRVQSSDRVILVCNDGRLSSTVARMLGVCGFPDVEYLKGGLRAWAETGGYLMETTRRGTERRVHPGGDPDASGVCARFLSMFSPSVLIAAVAGSAGLLGALALLWCR